MEFFEKREEPLNLDFSLIENRFERPLPESFKDFLNNYHPIDYFDYKYYTEDVYIDEEDCQAVVIHKDVKITLGDIYSFEEILNRLRFFFEDGNTKPLAETQLVPFIEGYTGHGGYAICVHPDRYGKIYFAPLYDEFVYDFPPKLGDEIANSINEFVEKISMIPFDEEGWEFKNIPII